MNAAIRQHAAGMPVDFERQTVEQFLTQWLEDSVKSTVRPRIYVSYSHAKEAFPDMRWHDLRHSNATLQMAYGASPREITETLGHSQITMTMNVYTHVVPELQQRTMDRMDEQFGS